MSNLAYIGLGSNLQQPRQQLDHACQAIAALGDIIAISPYYRSLAIGPGQQDDYINAVVALSTTLEACDLLLALQQIENRQGRQRLIRWGARTLDLDILLFNDLTLSSEALTIPHPRLDQRNFVVWPLFDIAGDLQLPCGRQLATLKTALGQQGLEKLPQTR